MKLDSSARGGGRLWIALPCTIALVALAGCGGGGSSSSTTAATTAPTTPAPAATTATTPTTTPTSTTSTTAASGAPTVSTWSLPNGDLANTRAVTSQISSSNVKQLGVAWSHAITGNGIFGYYANTPVFGPDGTAYFQDLGSNVIAVDSKTGSIKWTHDYHMADEGPNGVTLSGGVIYGITPSFAFALDATTGKQLWRTGRLAAPVGSGATFFRLGQGMNIQPQVSDGKVFLSTSGQLHGGVAYALDARTGRIVWKLQEVKNAADRTGKVAPAGSGGAWNAPAVGPDGTVYFGFANPYRSVEQATKHPSTQLYNDSTVAVDPNTGKVKWHYQAIPNDFYDWDMQISPIYTEANGQKMVIDAGKMGYVYAFDADTGKLLWKRSVGRHNGHDNDNLLAEQHKLKITYPERVWPGTQGGVETNMALADGVIYVPVVNLWQVHRNATQSLGTSQSFDAGTGEMVALDVSTGKVLWDTKLPSSPYGDATVTNDLVLTTTFNGKVIAFSRRDGSIVWQEQLPAGTNASLSINGDTLVTAAGYPEGRRESPQIVGYRIGATGSTSTTPSGASRSSASGGAVSITAGKRVFTTTCASCHTLADAGSSGTTGPNLDQLKPNDALVTRQVTNGGGGMPAFGGTLSKSQIASVARYVSTVAGGGGVH